MTSRSTRNSREAALDAMSPDLSVSSSASNAVNSAVSVACVQQAVAGPSSSSHQPSPEFLAAVVSAVKASLAAERSALTMPVSAVGPVSASSSTATGIFGGVPSLPWKLGRSSECSTRRRIGCSICAV